MKELLPMIRKYRQSLCLKQLTSEQRKTARIAKLISLIWVISIVLQCDSPVSQSPSDNLPQLGPNEVIRVLSPNGGEQYTYGDTITVRWLQKVSVATNGMIRIHNGPSACQYWMESDAYLRFDRDRDTSASMYFKPVNDSTALGVYRVVCIDKDMVLADCTISFSGTQLRIEVYDEYGPVGFTCRDLSDAYFSVTKH
jgi:hypothetical protein